MKITNRLNLPEPLVRAVTNDPYSRGDSDYSVTQLIKPPRIVALERLHAAELVEDASDRIWALMGQIGHLVLERAAMAELSEQRLFTVRNGLKISGQFDVWVNRLIDYKFTSIWAVKDGLKPEWEQQVNLLCRLARDNDFLIDSAQIVVIFRDWSIGEARRNPDYPKQQVQVLDVPIWSAETQEAFLLSRIATHEAAKDTLPECTPLERWARPEKWALKKRGAIKATRLYDIEREALAGVTAGYEVEHRPGVQTRCLDYCTAAPFCQQFQKLDPEGYAAKRKEYEEALP